VAGARSLWQMSRPTGIILAATVVGVADVWLEGKAPKRGRVVWLHPQAVAEGPSYSVTDSAQATIPLSRNPALRW
jgi:hypothetical protein